MKSCWRPSHQSYVVWLSYGIGVVDNGVSLGISQLFGPATRLWVVRAGAGDDGDVDITAVVLVKGGREKGGKG